MLLPFLLLLLSIISLALPSSAIESRAKRAATAKKDRIWPDGVIPFIIAANFSGEHKNLFVRAMRHWENHTCVSFVPKENHHKHYIFFTVDKCGCCSYVGRRGDGPQAISIGKNCDKFGIVVHELGHVVGFWHEHTRPDRDKYVDIFYKSIQPGQDYNFDKAKPGEVNSLDEPYDDKMNSTAITPFLDTKDFNSIMHYARDTFSRGAFHDTILPKPNSGFRSEIGQRIQLSEGDIRQAMKLYKCPACGGSLLEETAALVGQTAGKCVWRIIAPMGNTIFLNLTGNQLAAPKNGCIAESENYIAVKDGYSARAPLIDKICGDELSFRTVVSSSNRLYVEMKSSAAPAAPIGVYFSVCGGPIEGNEGIIQSPRYPESYPPGADCLWTVRVPEGFQIAIHITFFHHKDCIYDRVIFTEGGADGEVIDTICGQLSETDIVTKNSSSMGIRFISDSSVQKLGFEMRFQRELDECSKGEHDCEQLCINTVGSFTCGCREGFSLRADRKTCESTCGGQLKGPKGFFSSPSFPSFYPPNKSCIWNIEVEESQHIYLNFTSFNIEGLKSECSYDYVRISSQLSNGEKMCGELTQPLLLAFHTNQLKVEFASDASVERRGFAAQFIADTDECRINNGGCEQICRNRLGSYECGCQPGFVLVADGHNCKEGGCFFELNSPSGAISSPDYPLEYPKNLNCTWHFVTTPGHRLMLTFSSFQVEEHSQCKYDFAAIFDGGDSAATLAGVYCGVTSPPLFLSTSNQLFLAFSSDASVSRKGFEAQYASVCGGSLTAEEAVGHIYSHAAYSDSRYPKGQDCWWRIAASSSQRAVQISFSSFHIEHDVGCQYDYVEVYEGLEQSPDSLVGRYCGDTIPPPFSSSSSLLLIFHSDDSDDEKGFVAEYKEVSQRVKS